MLNGFQAHRILLCILFCFVLFCFVCLFVCFFTMAGLDGAKIFVQLTLSW